MSISFRHWPRAVKATFALGWLSTVACANEVTDTEGRLFTVDCDEAQCHLVERDQEDRVPLSVTSDGRLLRACEAAPGDDARHCRALTCASDSECRAVGSSGFTCVHGLCQDDQRAISDDDRLALCLAGTGPWTGSIEQRRRTLLARSCAPPCTTPAQCRAP